MKTQLVLQNVKCNGCASTITSKLTELGFVSVVVVDAELGTVEVTYEKEANLPEILETLRKLGYPQMGDTNPLSTKAKSYLSCAIGKMN
jgi:copper chaperone CopZ